MSGGEGERGNNQLAFTCLLFRNTEESDHSMAGVTLGRGLLWATEVFTVNRQSPRSVLTVQYIPTMHFWYLY